MHKRLPTPSPIGIYRPRQRYIPIWEYLEMWICVPWKISRYFKIEIRISNVVISRLFQIGMRHCWVDIYLSGRRGKSLCIFELWDLLEIKEMRILKCRTLSFQDFELCQRVSISRVIISLSHEKNKDSRIFWKLHDHFGFRISWTFHVTSWSSKKIHESLFFSWTKIL